MRNTHFYIYYFLVIFSFISCSSDPEYPESHYKTLELIDKYGSIVKGDWHRQYISDNQMLFEQLHLKGDSTMTGYVKWLARKKVSVEGKETWTDWDTIANDSLKGTWRLLWHNGTDYIIFTTNSLKPHNIVWTQQAELYYATDQSLQIHSSISGKPVEYTRGTTDADF